MRLRKLFLGVLLAIVPAFAFADDYEFLDFPTVTDRSGNVYRQARIVNRTSEDIVVYFSFDVSQVADSILPASTQRLGRSVEIHAGMVLTTTLFVEEMPLTTGEVRKSTMSGQKIDAVFSLKENKSRGNWPEAFGHFRSWAYDHWQGNSPYRFRFYEAPRVPEQIAGDYVIQKLSDNNRYNLHFMRSAGELPAPKTLFDLTHAKAAPKVVDGQDMMQLTLSFTEANVPEGQEARMIFFRGYLPKNEFIDGRAEAAETLHNYLSRYLGQIDFPGLLEEKAPFNKMKIPFLLDGEWKK